MEAIYVDQEAQAIAWASGLIEGEGTLSLFKYNHRPNSWACRVTVTMSDEDIVNRLHNVFKEGTVRGPFGKKEKRKPLYSWSVQNHRGCYNVLNKIYPFLGVRRKEKAGELLIYLKGKVIEG